MSRHETLRIVGGAVAAAIAVVGIFAACSSSSSGGDGRGGQGDAAYEAAGQIDGGGSEPDAGPAGDAGGGPANPAHVGTVDVVQYVLPQQTQWSVFADFQSNAIVDAGPDPRRTCATTIAGDCTLVVCSPVDAAAPQPLPAPIKVSAGPVTFKGGMLPPGTTVYPVDGGQYQGSLGEAGVAVKNGDVISVSAMGDTVPAFSNLSVVAVPTFTVTSPACDGGIDCGAIDRSQDIVFAWNGIPAGTMQLNFFTTSTDPVSYSATCRFPASKGMGTLSTALLSKFPSPAGVEFELESHNESIAVVGDYSVTFSFVGNYVDGTYMITK